MGRALDDAIWGQRRLWVEKQCKSGLSMAQFCRVNELSISNFYAWKQRLDAEPSGVPLAKGKVITKQVRDRGVFVQMPAAVQAVASGMLWVEISQADGMVVRVPASNLAALKLVLGVLAANEEVPGA
jgi:hypothetical protein